MTETANNPTVFPELSIGAVFARDPYIKKFVIKLSHCQIVKIKHLQKFSEADFFARFPTTPRNRSSIKQTLSAMNLSFGS